MRRFVAVFAVVATVFSCQQPKKPEVTEASHSEAESQPNIVLMIGDGMGHAQVTAATYWNPEESNYLKFRTIGLSKTSSTNKKVTDSAAGATAMATGQKSYNRAISVSPDSTKLITILEELKAKGYQTGLISLTSITHATPACFYAHVTDRDMHEDIAAQLVDADVDFFAGGGWKYFNQREDERNLLKEFAEKGYNMDTTALATKIEGGKKYGFLMNKSSMPSKVEGRGDFLKEATALALKYFQKSDKPYFLMVEGSYIDWGGHAEDAQMMIQESVEFDQTVGLVLDKTANDPNTLVVVTADHETGGVAIGKYYEEDAEGKKVERGDTLGVYFNTDQHTAALVPVFAKGYQEALFGGVYENNEIYHKLKEAASAQEK